VFLTDSPKEKFPLVVEGDFQITNIPYTIGFANRNSTEFFDLSSNITTQVINNRFIFNDTHVRCVTTTIRFALSVFSWTTRLDTANCHRGTTAAR